MLASSAEIDRLSEAQLREFTAALVQELQSKQALIDRLTHEMAIIKRLRFAAKSEHFNAQQKGLFDEDGDADLEALAQQLEQLASPQTSKVQSQTPKRQTLPADLPRREVRHEPTQTLCTCGCSLKRIGEDIAENRLRARSIHGRAPRARQVGVRPLRDARSGAGARPCDR